MTLRTVRRRCTLRGGQHVASVSTIFRHPLAAPGATRNITIRDNVRFAAPVLEVAICRGDVRLSTLYFRPADWAPLGRAIARARSGWTGCAHQRRVAADRVLIVYAMPADTAALLITMTHADGRPRGTRAARRCGAGNITGVELEALEHALQQIEAAVAARKGKDT